jgi:hypothetical protein
MKALKCALLVTCLGLASCGYGTSMATMGLVEGGLRAAALGAS